jgi:hypothetical protein
MRSRRGRHWRRSESSRFHFYDEGGLRKPDAFGESGYRHHGEAALPPNQPATLRDVPGGRPAPGISASDTRPAGLLRLQQILFFEDLD